MVLRPSWPQSGRATWLSTGRAKDLTDDTKAMRQHEPTVGETSEWFTPKYIFDALGLTFDLDPAHPGEGTPHCCVPARRVLTRKENGLLVPWHKDDLVWINSPQSEKRRAVVLWPAMRKIFRPNARSCLNAGACGAGVLDLIRARNENGPRSCNTLASIACVLTGLTAFACNHGR
jgi:hypothetical protein